MFVEIYNPWLRSLRWNILLLLGFCAQDVFAVADSLELAGVVAGGIIGLFLLVSAVIAALFFCKRLKDTRKNDINKMLDRRNLEQSIYQTYSIGGLNQSARSNHIPTITNDNMYMETTNSLYHGSTRNMNPNLPQPVPQLNAADYERRESIRSITSYNKILDRNKSRVTSYSISQALDPSTLETRATVHEKYDRSMRQPDTMELNASRRDSEFVLKKRQDILPDVSKVKQNEHQSLSATEFMLNSRRERPTERSDLGYVSNGNNNTSSLKNGGRFLTVGDSSQAVDPAPDYETKPVSESEHGDISNWMEYQTSGFETDLLEIRKHNSPEINYEPYKGNWDDSYSKQVQFNSNPENIALW